MKAIRKNVLLEQKFTKKIHTIITSIDQSKPSEEEYKVVIKVLQLGAECPTNEIKEGDIVFLNNYASPLKVEKVSGKVGDNEIINKTIFSYEDIVGKE